MPLSLKDSQTLSQFASFLYGFLPGSGFAAVAQRTGLQKFWTGGSKQPAILSLLSQTYEWQHGTFCSLIVELVRQSIAYGMRQGNPVTRDNVVHLNEFVRKLGFKIPDLWDPGFLDSLPSATKTNNADESADLKGAQLAALRAAFSQVQAQDPKERGYGFERFLKTLFEYYGLDPRASFRLVGEQIDGSFEFEKETYLVEAKWQDKLADESDLLVLHGKTSGKAVWARGLFVSYAGFSPDGLDAFGRGKATNIVGVTGQDLHFVLEGRISLPDALHLKVRRAVETGRFYIPVYELR